MSNFFTSLKYLIIIISTIVGTMFLINLCSTNYRTSEGWEFSQDWDYRCDNGFTYSLAARSIYPIFDKTGKPLSCNEVINEE